MLILNRHPQTAHSPAAAAAAHPTRRSPRLLRLCRRIVLGVQKRRAKHQEADHDAQSGGVVRVRGDEEPLVLAVGEGPNGHLRIFGAHVRVARAHGGGGGR